MSRNQRPWKSTWAQTKGIKGRGQGRREAQVLAETQLREKHVLATLSRWPSLFTAAVAMKAPVFSHTCPPHLLPHSLLPSFRVNLQRAQAPLPRLGSHPAVLPKQRNPHRYKPRKPVSGTYAILGF